MSVTPYTLYGSGSSGWTQITQDGGGVTRYVSQSTGADNAYPTNGTQASPWKTLTYAMGQFNALTNNKDNWLLLKCGDTWTETQLSLSLSGADNQHPVLISSYGTGARPKILMPSSLFSDLNWVLDLAGDYWAVIGLEIYAYQNDPANNPGAYVQNSYTGIECKAIQVKAHFNWALIEDCLVHCFPTNMAFQPDENSASLPENLYVHRCQILDALNTFVESKGIFLSYVQNLTCEECIFDQNGWSSALQTAHAVTFSGASGSALITNYTGHPFLDGNTVIFDATGGNIVTGHEYSVRSPTANSFQLQQNDGAYAAVTATGSEPATCNCTWLVPGIHERSRAHGLYYVAYSTSTNNGGPRGRGYPVVFRGNIFSNDAQGAQLRTGGTITNNLGLHNPSTLIIWAPTTFATVASNNVCMESTQVADASYQLGYGGGDLPGASNNYEGDNVDIGSISMQNNIYANASISGGFPGIEFDAGSHNSATYNIVYSWNNLSSNEILDNHGGAIINNNQLDGRGLNNTNGGQASNEPFTLHAGSPPGGMGNNTISYYAGTVGLTATTAAFITRARQQSKANWDDRYTANAANNYIRAGFNLGLTISPTTAPNGTVGIAYNGGVALSFTASGGTAPYTWTHSGTVPPGLTFNDAMATLSGTPTSAVGSPFTFRVNATDSLSVTGFTDYTVVISAPAITISPSSLPPGTIGTPYNQSVTASGGTAPYTYAISSGSLPPGLSLNVGTGAITGTPTGSPNIYPFAITATDSLSNSSLPQSYNIQIFSAPAQPKVSPMGAACM